MTPPALKDLFRGKQKYVTVKPASIKHEIPDGLWLKCEKCGQMTYGKELAATLKVCPKCGYHFKMSAMERIAMIADEGSFVEYDSDLIPADPLGFPGYREKVEKSVKATGLSEAIVTGEALVGGYRAAIGAMDFGFIGASMGSVVGEKVARTFERATLKRLPVIMFCTSGGARMQEGILSLMQMAKTSGAVMRHSHAGLLYISVLTNPTTAGVFASFASLGDIIIAEPEAQIGFAGPRVIEETIRQKLPPGFQTSEFVERHGMIDKIVERSALKPTLVTLLSLHDKRVVEAK
ncbi:MAG TPA: acetyl-CoA carboxylase carboxyltransferase subunit beta [Firmicutes bacterium]|nr:acetyl-CoA carboxylase carboxyltransferase subunit beta [Bacillota bacterium]